jgi:hypothetical protein
MVAEIPQYVLLNSCGTAKDYYLLTQAYKSLTYRYENFDIEYL